MLKLSHAFLKNRASFIPFIMAGIPRKEDFIKAIFALEESGADIIEVGVPFSDPVADGPINQEASKIAIENGMTLTEVLNQVKQVKNMGLKIPLVLFTYLNPILTYGEDKFIKTSVESGVNAVLVVDLPAEEGKEFYKKASLNGLEIVLLISPTTNQDRFYLYKELNPCFIYYISRLSVTGMKNDISKNLESELLFIRKNLPEFKIAVGFGISTIEQAKFVAKISDGVVIGSKLVATLLYENFDNFKRLSKDFSDAIHLG